MSSMCGGLEFTPQWKRRGGEWGRQRSRKGGREWKSRFVDGIIHVLKLLVNVSLVTESMLPNIAGILIQAQMPWSQHCGISLALTTCV